MADSPLGLELLAFREGKPDARVWALVTEPDPGDYTRARRFLASEAMLERVTFVERPTHPTVTALARGTVKATSAGPRGAALTIDPPHFFVDGARVRRAGILRLHGDGSATVEGAE